MEHYPRPPVERLGPTACLHCPPTKDKQLPPGTSQHTLGGCSSTKDHKPTLARGDRLSSWPTSRCLEEPSHLLGTSEESSSAHVFTDRTRPSSACLGPAFHDDGYKDGSEQAQLKLQLTGFKYLYAHLTDFQIEDHGETREFTAEVRAVAFSGLAMSLTPSTDHDRAVSSSVFELEGRSIGVRLAGPSLDQELDHLVHGWTQSRGAAGAANGDPEYLDHLLFHWVP
ncbi:hypothetical protein BHM03_00046423 [Ensete ventricosum]|nr:hypothetical protein BHM03_00046423 [Ensete ventricosum]